MTVTSESKLGIRVSLFAVALAIGVGLGTPSTSAKTPDGQTPAQETVCAELTGAAFGLCNAYCEAQDCDVHDRPSCAILRRNFARITGSPLFPCDPRCGDGRLNQANEQCDDGNNTACDGCSPTCTIEFCGDGVVCPPEECEPGDICGDDADFTCNEDCTCPRCPIFDRIIDADGTASAADGVPGFVEVRCGDPLLYLYEVSNVAGLDVFDNNGDFAWTFGLTGDDIHLEDPNAGTCPTAGRNAVYDNNPFFKDCVVLDLDGSLFDQQFVTCDNACYDRIAFFDRNGNGIYDDGEDIILDTNGSRVFD